jgi:hypothetical protein
MNGDFELQQDEAAPCTYWYSSPDVWCFTQGYRFTIRVDLSAESVDGRVYLAGPYASFRKTFSSPPYDCKQDIIGNVPRVSFSPVYCTGSPTLEILSAA